MTDRTLDVYCFGARAGTLTDAAGNLAFEYDTAWLRAERPQLSQSLPLSGGFDSGQVVAFFGGLLPEGRPRELLARQLGVSVTNDFGLLEQLGGDTAGAVSVQLPGSAALPTIANDVEWLDDAQLAELIDELPSARCMPTPTVSIDSRSPARRTSFRSSGRVGLTKGRTPSTHILKTPIDRLPDTVANEAFCLALGRRLGIATVASFAHASAWSRVSAR